MTDQATANPERVYLDEAACNDCLEELRATSRGELVFEMFCHLLAEHRGLEGMTFTVASERAGGLHLSDVPIYRAGLNAYQRAALGAYDELIARRSPAEAVAA